MRRMFVLGFCLAIALLAAMSGNDSVAQQTDAQATLTQIDKQISRLETRAAKVEAQQTEEAGGETSNGNSEETSGVNSEFFGYGTLPSLPKAESGEVAVVQYGVDQDGSVPIVIHNNTEAAVTIDQVVGTARDSDGTLIAQADYVSIAPQVLESGAYTIGVAGFGFDDLPDDASFEFEVEINPSFDSTADLVVAEAELTDRGMVGAVSNPLDHEVSLPSITGVCWDSEGSLIGYFTGFASKTDLLGGDTSPFDGSFYMGGVSMFDSPAPSTACNDWAIGATAFDLT